MLKGWTLTDLHCDQCRSTPLMREPAAQANAAGRAPIQFCAGCDGRPDDHAQPAHQDPPAVLTPESPSTPPAHHAAAARADPDAAADAISELMLKGYSLLGTNCPDPACAGIPLVGYPKRGGEPDGRRLCVSCGTRYVDEKDVEAAGLRPQHAHQQQQPQQAQPQAQAPPPGLLFGSAAPAPSSADAGGESPRSRMRREMYEQGAAMNAALAQQQKDAEAARQAASDPHNPQNEQVIGPISQHHYPSDEQLVGPVPARRSARSANHAAAPASKQARPPFVAAEHRTDSDGKFRVVLISSGSVASVKIPLIVEKLKSANVEVQVVATQASLHFFDKAEVERSGTNVWEDADEWSDWKKIGDPILHIELRRWADLIVVVPTSADMLAKLAGGICDSLATSLLRATPASTPVILCPAMNTVMYEHPLTARQEAFVRAVLGYYILGPQQGGKLACGDVGAGKMTEWTEIADAVIAAWAVFRKSGGDGAKLAAAIRKGAVEGLSELEPIDEELLRVELPQKTLFEASWRQASSTKGDAPAAPRSEAASSTRRRHHHEHHRHGSAASADSRRSTRSAREPSPLKTILQPLVQVFKWCMFPFLLALHVLFTLSSVVLRLFQSSPPSLPELEKPAPEHVALILVPGEGDRRETAERYVESVRRAVQWAAEWGTPVLSVWDGEGYGVRHHGAVSAGLLSLPPSPPSSDDGDIELRAVRGTRPDGGADMGESSVIETVYVNTASGPQTVTVVFLPPSAGEVVTRITQRYAADGVPPDSVTEALLDTDIRAALALPSDPDLVVVHHLTPPGFFRGLLPRPAPELHGFPAWSLRISEIYHHPPTLPFYVPFVGSLLQNSPLAILRKLGNVFPSRDEAGVLNEQAWEGAQNAWERVEQRRGK